MTVKQYAEAVEALSGFVQQPADRKGRARYVGMIGGEPLMHPEFRQLCELLEKRIPREHRAIFTGVRVDRHRLGSLVRRTFAYVNENSHDRDCFHQPVLVAPCDVVADAVARERYIAECPLQEEWSSTITPRGFFFCEVAGAFDAAFNGPGGLAVESSCWTHELPHYSEQVRRWCPRCGVCLPLPGRRDSEQRDDVSASNLAELRALGSPRITHGKFVETGAEALRPSRDWVPYAYLRSRP
jgi:hypothetical protein